MTSKHRIVSFITGLCLLAGALLAPWPAGAKEPEEDNPPRTEADSWTGELPADMEWDVDMAEATASQYQARPAGADETLLPQRDSPVDTAGESLAADQLTQRLTLESGVYTLPGVGQIRADSGQALRFGAEYADATIDLTGVQLEIAAAGGAALQLEGAAGLTLKGLTIVYVPDSEQAEEESVDDLPAETAPAAPDNGEPDSTSGAETADTPEGEEGGAAPAEPAIRLSGCQNITLEDVAVFGGGDGIVADEDSGGVMLRRVYLEGLAGDGVRFEAGSRNTLLTHSVVHAGGAAARDISETGAEIIGNVLSGEMGVEAAASGCVVKYNDIRGAAEPAVRGTGGRDRLIAKNRLVAQGVPLALEDAVNTVVLGNEIAAPQGMDIRGGADLTVADNVFDEPLTLQGVDIALVTGNIFRGSGRADAAILAGDTGTRSAYGGNIPAAAKTGAGANESLLPQVNKNRFKNLPRAATILSEGKEVTVAQYVRDSLTKYGEVILPPGAYSLASLYMRGLVFSVISAYGVLFEFSDFTRQAVTLSACADVSLRGLTIDFSPIGHAQGTVTGRDAAGNILWRSDGGYPGDLTDTTLFPAGTLTAEAFRQGSSLPFTDYYFTGAHKNADGTMALLGAATTLEAGDRLVLRAKFAPVCYATFSGGTLWEDVTILGGSGFALAEWGGEGGTRLNRVAVTPGPAPTLYGGVQGKDRLVSTCDATHSTQMRRGITVTNCLFERMTDDGANINGEYRVATHYSSATRRLTYDTSKGQAIEFRPGDRLIAFTREGRTLYDGPVADASVTSGGQTTVTLPAGARLSYLAGKTLVENASANGAGFLYENTLVQHNRSRGIVVKAPDGAVKNCTLRGNGMSGILLKPEVTDNWGESGYTSGVSLTGNLVESTGYFADSPLYTPLNISGDASAGAEADTQSHRHVTLEDNEVKDRHTGYAVRISGAQNVTLRSNRISAMAGRSRDTDPVVRLEGVTGANVSGNTFPAGPEHLLSIDGNTVKNLRGNNIRKADYLYQVDSITLRPRAKTLERPGHSLTLSALLQPAGAASAVKITWASSNSGVARVSARGRVTAVAAGKATITAKTPEGKTAACRITVGDRAVKSVKLNKTKITLKKGKSYLLKATVSPKNAGNKLLHWESSNKKIATVSRYGRVRAVGQGRCKITVYTNDGNKKRVCTVTVK